MRGPYVYLHGGKVSFFKNPFSATIQFGTDSVYWHVGAEWDDPWAIEALFWPGLVKRNQNEIPINDRQFIDVFECIEPVDWILYRHALLDQLYKKYDKLGIVSLAVLKLKRDHESANRLQKDKDYFCSEAVAIALRKGGAVLPDVPLKGTASPADIARSKSFKFIRRIRSANTKVLDRLF